MADDAFALSPISARASMPTEADYEAICGAFMETARGRWFLGEYAKRNRNADTRMVLDAVERIEATLASQKAAADHSLVELLPAITALISNAQQRILDTLPKGDTRPATEPIQRAAGILRDVAWTLRESGSDTRVCDLLDVQAKAIVDGCARMHGDQTGAPDISAAIAAALDGLTRQISALAKSDTPPPAAAEPVRAAPPVEALREQPATEPSQPANALTATLDVVAPDEPEAAPTATTEPAEVAAPAKLQPAPEQQVAPQASMPLSMVEVDVQANLWEDLEITDVDPDDALPQPPAAVEPAAVEPPPVVMEATVAEPSPAVAEPQAAEPALAVDDAPPPDPEVPTLEPAVALAPELPQRPAPSSLGQAALEGGAVLAAPRPYSEALAPIHRMSQAEKIAFFS